MSPAETVRAALRLFTGEVLHRLGVGWMDSCVVARNITASRLWIDRRTIQTIVVPTGGKVADLAVAAMPLVRWLRRQLGSRMPPGAVVS